MSTRFDLRRRWLLAAAAGWVVVGAPGLGQSAAASPKGLTYDVVSIKPNKTGGNMMRIQNSTERFLGVGVSVETLLVSAYNLKTDDQVVGLSGPVSDARFDIEAKMDEATIAALKLLSEDERRAQRQAMMWTMLEERFKLKVHAETKELPMYALMVAKGGAKVKQADPNDAYANGVKGPDGVGHGGMMMMRNGTLTGQAISISDLANNLGRQLQRQVLDKTGLTGKYDFTLTWSPDEGGPGGGGADAGAASSAPSIFTALQEQLGLKLESTKGPVDTVVVDHVEMPSEN